VLSRFVFNANKTCIALGLWSCFPVLGPHICLAAATTATKSRFVNCEEGSESSDAMQGGNNKDSN